MTLHIRQNGCLCCLQLLSSRIHGSEVLQLPKTSHAGWPTISQHGYRQWLRLRGKIQL
jgi:hypothetical protein